MIRVAMVSLHACIRAQKMAYELQNLGHEVHLVSQFISHTHSSNGYTTVHHFEPTMTEDGIDDHQLRNAVKLLDPHVDVWHVHNEPNWIFRSVKEETKKPVIFDIHDWTTLRKAAPLIPYEVEEEKYALEHADAFCVPSKGYLRRVREITSKPSMLVYSMLGTMFFPREKPVLRPGVTYAGGLKGKSNGEALEYNYPYRDWSSFVKGFLPDLPEGFKFYGYSANGGEDFSNYPKEVEISAPLVYPNLIAALAQHSIGIVGSPYPLLDFEDSMPNKLFEYVAAGIPCVVVNAPEAARYVEENNLGKGIRDASEVVPALHALTDYMVFRDRWAFTMESQIPKLLALYEEVLCTTSPRLLSQIGRYV